MHVAVVWHELRGITRLFISLSKRCHFQTLPYVLSTSREKPVSSFLFPDQNDFVRVLLDDDHPNA
jgi:hypothetical protein